MDTCPNGYQLKIIDHRSELNSKFNSLNRAWITKYFDLKLIDKEILENPDYSILKKGGQIFFAKYHHQIIGNIALKFVNETTYELTKLAVDESYQRLGAEKAFVLPRLIGQNTSGRQQWYYQRKAD